VNTQNILFICGGAFVGLDGIVQRRLGARGIGFGAHTLASGASKPSGTDTDTLAEGLSRSLAPEDLVRYGMIPEFIGRLPVVSVLAPLKLADLERVLQDTKNSLVKQYAKLFAMDGVTLRFTDDALRAIAQKAMTLKTGARALRSILEQLMLDVMYDLPARDDVAEVVISGAVVEGEAKPKLKRKSRSTRSLASPTDDEAKNAA
jgi:ATP-dependent Clp protease ATP-binding subunit ClpX